MTIDAYSVVTFTRSQSPVGFGVAASTALTTLKVARSTRPAWAPASAQTRPPAAVRSHAPTRPPRLRGPRTPRRTHGWPPVRPPRMGATPRGTTTAGSFDERDLVDLAQRCLPHHDLLDGGLAEEAH